MELQEQLFKLPRWERPGETERDKSMSLTSSQASARAALHQKYRSKLRLNPKLSRSLVSYQANKNTPFFRWFKFKEAFSSELVRYILKLFGDEVPARSRTILDPFAGAGTTVLESARLGWDATGVELLPVAVEAVRNHLVARSVDTKLLRQHISRLVDESLQDLEGHDYSFPHLRITRKAFPPNTEKAISGYRAFLHSIEEPNVRRLFWFASLAVLEQVSYTRKDGQYLRWDHRSGRRLRSKFRKGAIPDFKPAVLKKLNEIASDIERFRQPGLSGEVNLIEGSVLEELPNLPSDSYGLILTSPPYCNRYDYTRTYALELAYLGKNEEEVKQLRQALLSSTVENKPKKAALKELYRTLGRETVLGTAHRAFLEQEALQEVLALLWEAREQRRLNNNNIPTMVENYFYEINLVIRELARVLAPKGRIVMVNDNVQYIGEVIPVDLILSDLAAASGLEVEAIWILANGKGNSSQQMGAFGRNELRKCVYVWAKPGP